MLTSVAESDPKEDFILHLPSSIKTALGRQAKKEGLTQRELAERYLIEAIRLAEHSGIVFRSGPAGRRAAVVGGPDVWEVVETFIAEGRKVEATARYLSLTVRLVRAAVDYYADNSDEMRQSSRRKPLRNLGSAGPLHGG